MANDLFLNAEVHAGPLTRRDTVAGVPIDFDLLLWHAGVKARFGPWSVRVEEIDAGGRAVQVVPHQWEPGRLYWQVPGLTPAGTRRRFRIGLASDPGPPPAKNNLNDRIVLTDLGAEILFSRNERELRRYRYRNVFKPFFCPVNGPDGSVVRDIVYDAEGHFFHHGIWVGYGSMDQNGANLWCESDAISPRRGPTGRMAHESFERFQFGAIYGTFRERLAYQKPDGHIFAREWRTVRVSTPGPETLALDVEITLQEPEDTGPRTTQFCCRVASSMRVVDATVRPPRPLERPGRIERGPAWADYSGPVGEGWNGVALFDHPGNPDFPRAPGATEYGLMSLARTYPTADGYRGSTVTYRYRAWIHNGDAAQAGVAQAWEDYAYPCRVTVGELQR